MLAFIETHKLRQPLSALPSSIEEEFRVLQARELLQYYGSADPAGAAGAVVVKTS